MAGYISDFSVTQEGLKDFTLATKFPDKLFVNSQEFCYAFFSAFTSNDAKLSFSYNDNGKQSHNSLTIGSQNSVIGKNIHILGSKSFIEKLGKEKNKSEVQAVTDIFGVLTKYSSYILSEEVENPTLDTMIIQKGLIEELEKEAAADHVVAIAREVERVIQKKKEEERMKLEEEERKKREEEERKKREAEEKKRREEEEKKET